MNNSKSTKRSLLMSALALVMCLSMFVGSTFAWFTDSVTSSNNIIKSGTLDVAMTYADKVDGTYKDASEGAIFDYKLLLQFLHFLRLFYKFFYHFLLRLI